MKLTVVQSLVCCLWLCVVVNPTSAKLFSRCELAVELYKIHGLSLESVPTLVCIAGHTSMYSTTLHNEKANGMFGIYDGWCSVDSYGGGCQLLCSDLRDDSISDDITCVKHIFREHQKKDGNGFMAWGSYQTVCKNRTESDKYIDGCFA